MVTVPVRLAVRIQEPEKLRVTVSPSRPIVASAVVASKLASAGWRLMVMV